MKDKLAYTVNEATEALGFGRTKLYELVKTGELTLLKAGRRSLIKRADLEAFLARLPVREAA